MINNYAFCELTEKDMVTIYGGGSEDIAVNLKLLRITSGFNRRDLADMMNVSLSTITKYEKGSRIPDIDTIIKLAEMLNTDVESLIF
ncbi:helix-turn-helix domain-containing protein [Leuconostoc gasicomitatum]|uniref:Helix-turn-helix transcriptional regulator n=1 Tax=Leuconostoc gasicomitatum TaxID=115778 RepID=A0A9Q3XT32_9LACO|nr:helix-turn-helix transcriptional regulator [Leuconostoc gasicomitatum]MBZ5947225.1 helix-turn-helix transcriptional regulator [Leuconostoc gasicomitatum]MBZ5962235.1 helix-turn-helix transcriptional regulator [Leuconostoc gasicomitatum]